MLSWFAVVLLLSATATGSEGDVPGLSNVVSSHNDSGNALVDARSGAASYAYPFALPPGRDNFTPSLNLVYSSNARDSWTGYGFQLAMPTIRRETRNGHPDYMCGASATAASGCFVADVGGSVSPLLPMGPVTGPNAGYEYRTARDNGDVQFILRTDGDWMTRTRNGVVSTFAPGILRFPYAPPVSSQTFSWNLVRSVDAHGNLIEYAYNTTWSSSTPWGVPRLSDVYYGGTDGVSAPAIPHLFHVALQRDHAPVMPPMLANGAPTPFACFTAPRLSYRSGAGLDEGGETEILRAVGVEVAWPGSTEGTSRVAATRRVRYWQLHYNWEAYGCTGTDQLWPQITSVNPYGIDELGTETAELPTTFVWNGWDRTAFRVIHVSTGTFGAFQTAGVSPLTYPRSLTVSAPNDPMIADHLGFTGVAPCPPTIAGPGTNSPSCVSRPVYATGGRLSGLMDVDQDGIPDLVDMSHSSHCVEGQSDATGRWAQLMTTHMYGTSTATLASPAPLDWLGNIEFASQLQPLPATNPVYSTSQIYNCALEPAHAWMRASYGGNAYGATADLPVGPSVTSADVVFADFDGDGYVDALRNANSNFDAQWELYRNQTTRGANPDQEYSTTGLQLATVPWRWTDPAGVTDATSGFYEGRYLHILDNRGSSLNESNGSVALSARFDMAATDPATLSIDATPKQLYWSSGMAGFVADFNGDGLPDRLASVDSTVFGYGTLTLYPGEGVRNVSGAPTSLFGTGRAWFAGNTGQSPYIDASVSPFRRGDERAVGYVIRQTDQVVDMNGDGYPDLLTMYANPFAANAGGGVVVGQVGQQAFPWILQNNGAFFETPVAIDIHAWPNYGLAETVYDVQDAQFRRAVHRRQTITDFNGDGLPDVVSSAGWWMPNRGGNWWDPATSSDPSARTFSLIPPTPGVGWGDEGTAGGVVVYYQHNTVGVPIERTADVTTWQNLMVDVTGDGRPDLLVMTANGLDVYTDADASLAPGRLREVHHASGAWTSLSYETLQMALDSYAPGVDPLAKLRGVPASAWIVSSVVEHSDPGPTRDVLLTTTYQYSAPHFGPAPDQRIDPNNSTASTFIAHQPYLRGFGLVTTCLPSSTLSTSAYSYDDPSSTGRAPDAVMTEHMLFDSCAPGTAHLLQDDVYQYERHVVQSAATQEQIVRDRLLSEQHEALNPTDPPHGGITVQTTYDSYQGDTMLPLHVTTSDHPLTSSPANLAHVRSVQYVQHTDSDTTSSYKIVPSSIRDWGSTAGNATSPVEVSFVEMQYDGLATGLSGRGDITTVLEHRADADATPLATRIRRDVYGHVIATVSPMGRTEAFCWDTRAMYAIRHASASGLTTERVVSFVNAATLEARGPTGIVPLTIVSGLPVCDPVDTSAPGWLSNTVPPAIAQITYQTPVMTDPTIVPPLDTLSPPLVGGGGGGGGGAGTPNSLVAFPLERVMSGAVDDTAPTDFESIASVGNLLSTPPGGPTPGALSGVTPPHAPGGRLTLDHLGRVVRSDVALRVAGSLVWSEVVGRQYLDVPASLSATEYRYIDATNVAVATTAFDGFGNTRQRSWNGSDGTTHIASWSYELLTGRLHSASVPDPSAPTSGASVTTTFGYDAQGRTTQVTSPDGTSTTIGYATGTVGATTLRGPSTGLWTTITDNVGATASIVERDGFGRVVGTLVGPALLATFTAYDAAGRVASVTEPDGATTTYAFPDFRGLVQTTSRYPTATAAASMSTAIETNGALYNDDGQVTQQTDAAGNLTVFNYDGFGRLYNVHRPSLPLFGYGDTTYGFQDTYQIDGAGAVRTYATPVEQITLGFDERRQVISDVRSFTATFGGHAFRDKYSFGYLYNNAGQCATTHADALSNYGAPAKGTFAYSRNVMGLISNIAETDAGIANIGTFTYSPLGQLATRSDVTGASESWTYDNMGRQLSQTVMQGTSTRFRQALMYTTDGHGMPSQINSAWEDGYKLTLANTFDGANRLLTATDGGGAYAYSQTFDASLNAARVGTSTERIGAGAAIASTYNYGSASSVPFGLDPAAVLSVSRPSAPVSQQYNATGAVVSQTSGATTTYGVDPAGVLRSTSTGAEYLYDADGTRSHVFDPVAGTLTATVGGLVRADYHVSGSGFAPTGAEFLGGLGNTPVARVDQTGRVTYVHVDRTGSVVLARHATASGGLTGDAWFAYAPYGTMLHSGHTGTSDPSRELWRYKGGMIDPSGGASVLFGFRRYDPTTHHWASQDPAFDTLPFAFANENPLAFSDPLGLDDDPLSASGLDGGSSSSPPPTISDVVMPTSATTTAADGTVTQTDGSVSVPPGSSTVADQVINMPPGYPPPEPWHDIRSEVLDMTERNAALGVCIGAEPCGLLFGAYQMLHGIYNHDPVEAGLGAASVVIPGAVKLVSELRGLGNALGEATDEAVQLAYGDLNPVAPASEPALVEGGEVWNSRGGIDCSRSTAFRGQVQIEYTGSRRLDYLAANLAAGLRESRAAPRGLVWHHLDDYNPLTNRGTMQLVEQDTHMANMPHVGGVSQWVDFFGRAYGR